MYKHQKEKQLYMIGIEEYQSGKHLV